MTIRVLMIPSLARFEGGESGIKRVVEAYHRYAQQTGIEYVDCPVSDSGKYDVFAVHAGSTDDYPKDRPTVSICHGLYWVEDYQASAAEWHTNAFVIESLRRAQSITVPSEWVAESIRRDVRVNPTILPHGIEWEQWQHTYKHEDYVLWNKNRAGDVCDPTPVSELAQRFPDVKFLTTFAGEGAPGNVEAIGLQPHENMKILVQRSGVYLATTKETFGIGTLEALASGSPVLGFAWGGNLDLVQHGVDGYLAKPGDYDDLAVGLAYCIQNREVLGKNGIMLSKKWTWENAAKILSQVYQSTWDKWNDLHGRPLKIEPALYAS